MNDKFLDINENDLSSILEELLKAAQEIKDATVSEATAKAYTKDFELFEKWCERLRVSALPAKREVIVLYLLYLYRKKSKASTICRILSSISQAHQIASFESPIDGLIRQVKKGIVRKLGENKRQSKPLLVEHLERIISFLPQDIIGCRDKALILIGFSAALRRSEIVALNVEDFEEVPEGLVVTIRKSKTDQTKKGYKIGLPFAMSKKNLCPVMALKNWLAVACIKNDAVFRTLGKINKGVGADFLFENDFAVSKNRLLAKTVSLIVKRTCSRAGYDPANFSAHSLRSGFATSASSAGISDRDIQAITRHRSRKMLDDYIRDGALFRDHPLARIL